MYTFFYLDAIEQTRAQRRVDGVGGVCVRGAPSTRSYDAIDAVDAIDATHLVTHAGRQALLLLVERLRL